MSDKIHVLEKVRLYGWKELEELGKDGVYSTTNRAYGKGEHVEAFTTKQYNIVENKDLRALERRLPKNWKKGKWTPPVDPYDPLSNMKKKR